MFSSAAAAAAVFFSSPDGDAAASSSRDSHAGRANLGIVAFSFGVGFECFEKGGCLLVAPRTREARFDARAFFSVASFRSVPHSRRAVFARAAISSGTSTPNFAHSSSALRRFFSASESVALARSMRVATASCTARSGSRAARSTSARYAVAGVTRQVATSPFSRSHFLVSPAGLAGDVAQLSTAFAGYPGKDFARTCSLSKVSTDPSGDASFARKSSTPKNWSGAVASEGTRPKRAAPPEARRAAPSRDGPNSNEARDDFFSFVSQVKGVSRKGAAARTGGASARCCADAPGAGARAASFRNASSLLRSICSRIASSTTGVLCVCCPAELTAGAPGALRESGFAPTPAVGAGGLGAG